MLPGACFRLQDAQRLYDTALVVHGTFFTRSVARYMRLMHRLVGRTSAYHGGTANGRLHVAATLAASQTCQSMAKFS